MRTNIFLTALFLIARLQAEDEFPAFPLWDGHETVDAYAKKVNLPPAKSFDLGGGVTLDLLLIPAGRFVMGTQPPPEPAVSDGSAVALLCIGGVALLALLIVLVIRTIQDRKFSFSLLWLLLMSMSCGALVGGVVRGRMAKRELEIYNARVDAYNEIDRPEKPGFPVPIAQPFYMGKFTVTQAQFKAVEGYNPSVFAGAQFPVDTVTWEAANDFCAALNRRRLNAGAEFKLPSDAQWEYACKAGTRTAFSSGDTISTDDANFDGFLSSIHFVRGAAARRQSTTPVGSFKPNPFGLFDMHGNVWQWCADWQYFEGQMPAGSSKVLALRGGGYNGRATDCRSAARYRSDGKVLQSNIGFRVILTVPLPKAP